MKNETLVVLTVDAETGETEEREYTAEEIAEHEIMQAETLVVLTVDAETGETEEREYTAEEIAEHEIMQAEASARQKEQEAKAAARASALAKLGELGLTEEEVASL